MEKKNNLLLLKNLIDSDFLIKKDSRIKTSLKFLNSKILKNQMEILNPVEITLELKQLIRMLQFLKKQPFQLLNLTFQNKSQLEFLSFFLKKDILFYPFFLQDKKVKLEYLKKTQALLSFEQVKKSTLKRLTNNKIFLINSIFTKYNMFYQGIYRLHNDLATFKKLIFLIILLKKFYTVPRKKIYKK